MGETFLEIRWAVGLPQVGRHARPQVLGRQHAVRQPIVGFFRWRRPIAGGESRAGIRDLEHAAAAAGHHAATTRHHAAHASHSTHACAGASETAAGLERIDSPLRVDGQDEIRDRIDLHDQIFPGLLLRRDEENLVLDDVGEIEIGQEQTQRRSQRHVADVLRHRRLEVESGVLERAGVEFHRDSLLVLDRVHHVAEWSLRELEVLHGLVECVVDPLLGGARVGKIDRLVLFPQASDLPPAVGGRVDDGGFAGEGDGRDVGQVKRVHEATLLGAANAGVLGVVVENLGDDRRRAGDDACRHRHAPPGVEVRRRFCEAVGADPHLEFGIREGLGRPLVADADALLHERVIAFGERLEPLLAAVEVVDQFEFFSRGGSPLLGVEIPLRFLTAPYVRLADPDLDLSPQAVPQSGIEVVGRRHLMEEFPEVRRGGGRIGGKPRSGVAEPHGRLLLEPPGPDTSHPLRLQEFVGGGIGAVGGVAVDGVAAGPLPPLRKVFHHGRGSTVSRIVERVRLIVGPTHRDLSCLGAGCGRADHRRLGVVGVSPQRRVGQPDCRIAGSDRLGLPAELGKCRSLLTHRRPRQLEALAAERRQEDAAARRGVANQFREVGVVGLGRDARNCDFDPSGSPAVGDDVHLDPHLLERSLQQDDRVAVGAERRHPLGQHPHRCGV